MTIKPKIRELCVARSPASFNEAAPAPAETITKKLNNADADCLLDNGVSFAIVFSYATGTGFRCRQISV